MTKNFWGLHKLFAYSIEHFQNILVLGLQLTFWLILFYKIFNLLEQI